MRNFQEVEAVVQHTSSQLLAKNQNLTDVKAHNDAVLPSQGVSEKPPLDLVRQLCHLLAEEQISYCHWKSNNALDRSANGDNDLDLLVSRDDADRFNEILAQLGFKPGIAPPDRSMPGVLDFYGFDQGAGKIVHAHVHYQLVVGHDMTKNYRLPIEIPYLDSAATEALFNVPAPEYEFVVLVIRMILKHATWETLLIRHGKLSAEERGELTFLGDQVDQDKVKGILKQHLPTVSSDLFEACLKALAPNASLWTRIRVGNALLNALQAYARRGRFQDVTLKLYRRIAWGFQRRILKKAPKRFLANGGVMIAVVGGDGAGKTTAIDGLYDWLKHELAVEKVHLGKPKWSWTTRFIRAILSIGRTLGLYSFVSEADVLYTERAAKQLSFAHYALLIRQLLRSRDRLLTYIDARRKAMNGSIVIFDRFPVAQINQMDGPIMPALVNPDDMNKFVAWMIHQEQKNFEPFVFPELLIVLKLDPQIAAERKTDEESDYVRARSQLVWSVDWQQTRAHVVDASQRREKVLETVKSLVWSSV